MEIYGGKTTIHLGGGRDNFVLLPIIPQKAAANTRKSKASKAAKRKTTPNKKRRR
jgi:hypothetical protein